MTPSKKGKATHIRIERRKKLDMNGTESDERHHVGGGEHKGLVVNKSSQGNAEEDLGAAHVQLAFNCFMVDMKTQKHLVRLRKLKTLDQCTRLIVNVEDATEEMLREQLEELEKRELVKKLENEVQVVKQMNVVSASNQPTIAIITANYCEKMAVDAMMENKTTYVKYKVKGESNAYTIGFIGEHKCVSTKLPMIGHDRSAQISSGNTTTRLLGTFQQVEHVFVVGVGGGVPHFTNYFKHLRMGDEVIKNIKAVRSQRHFAPWEKYMKDGLELLSTQEADYNRPPTETDRLTMMIGEGNIIEMQHPHHPDGIDERHGMPKVFFGAIGAGKRFARDDDLRLDFAAKNGLQTFDSEFDQVLGGILGSVKDSFLFIRGIADYSDGMQKTEWQPYAALVAAAVTKSIIKSFKSPYGSEDEA
ncbi:hypothetical protein MAR_020347 [Mya arenaria]|uniref:Uncharacterized protein n=1 Tax=Mya arenaria TaxID=6604 RepID=A0ABY7E4P7_MYAAR|nr:hypothetical protein MAR_020347 [Mya arenaria]